MVLWGREGIQGKETSMSEDVDGGRRRVWGLLWETGRAGAGGKEISGFRRVALSMNLS